MAGLINQNTQRAKAIVAQFAAQIAKFILSISAGDGGTVSPAGDVEVEQGGSLRIEATPNAGFDHIGWLVDGELVPVNPDGSDVVLTD